MTGDPVGVTVCPICDNALVLHTQAERLHCRAERIRRDQATPQAPKVQDLMAALEESVRAAKAERARRDQVTRHPFTDGLTGRTFDLVLDPDSRIRTGVEHPGCTALAEVAPELDSAFCPRCHWQARISGAWFMDLWVGAATPPQPTIEGLDQ